MPCCGPGPGIRMWLYRRMVSAREFLRLSRGREAPVFSQKVRECLTTSEAANRANTQLVLCGLRKSVSSSPGLLAKVHLSLAPCIRKKGQPQPVCCSFHSTACFQHHYKGAREAKTLQPGRSAVDGERARSLLPSALDAISTRARLRHLFIEGADHLSVR